MLVESASLSMPLCLLHVRTADLQDGPAYGEAEAACRQSCPHLLRFTGASVHVQPEQPNAQRSFFTELLASMSDLKFSRCGRHMLARDFMGLKLWDVRMEASPVATFPIHEHLKHKVGPRDAASCSLQPPLTCRSMMLPHEAL